MTESAKQHNGNGRSDPTTNVLQLVDAAIERQDDLRAAEAKRLDERMMNLVVHMKETADLRSLHEERTASLRAEHQKELNAAESGRLNSIRQVDREDVAKAAASNNLAITTLAKQTTDIAAQLQAQVQTTAAAAEARRSTDMTEVNKRVSALELASSASAGKQTVADPQMEMLVKQVAALAALQQSGAGKSQGMNAAWVGLLGAVGLIATILSIYAVSRP